MLDTFYKTINDDEISKVLEEGASRMTDGLTFRDLVDLDRLHVTARGVIQKVLDESRIDADTNTIASIAQKLVARVSGLEFLMPLFKRDDISNIFINPDGTLRIQKKGQKTFETIRKDIKAQEVDRVSEALLRTSGRALTEATPSVDCKLPRIEALPGLMGGARVKLIHPVIATGKYDMPSISIRLYQTSPVFPEDIINWKSAPAQVIEDLLKAINKKARFLVVGGTNTGKTTLLSALCNGGIDKGSRIVKIEDPEEIWLEHDHVVTLEARPAPPGSSVAPYTIRDAVDDAMRMSPDWLIVGEVRTGDAALTLFRAQMSDHPGMSTFHAESPEFAIYRVGNLLISDTQETDMQNAKSTFAMAVDVIVQVGWAGKDRRILGIYEVEKILKDGDVVIHPLYKMGDERMKPVSVR
ncbi:MAG TPA: ATPase, T2SS/T4P/T4SS family [Pelolinea sp.]|nr:ATPase, T2SS/T4P/T4SS family [Pelolinea sp.]